MAEASTSRSDGRTDASLRPLTLSSGLLTRSDGSARFAFGAAEVLASVTGPQEVRLRDELLDRATLEVNALPVRGVPGPSSKALQHTLHLILVPLLLLHAHPRSLIQLTLQTTSSPSMRFSKSFKAFVAAAEDEEADDAAGEDDDTPAEESASAVTLAANLNAAIAALVDAGVGMRGLAAAVGVAVMPPTETTTRLILDPSPEEERDAEAALVVGFSFGEGIGGTEGDLTWCESCRTRRPISEDTLFDCIALAQTACQSVIAFLRKSVEAKYLGAQAVPSARPDDAAMQEG